MNDNSTQFTEFVFRRLTESLRLGGQDLDGRVWLAILIPVLLLGIFYVGWMYVRDSRSISWFWSAFLGLLRCAVYGILAFVFLLPAVQNWEENKSQSKVVVLWDVSSSMGTRDGIPTETVPVEKMPTRQDTVLSLLEAKNFAFLSRIMDTNPITAYRFGRNLDEDYVTLSNNRWWDRKSWEERQRASKRDILPEGRPITKDALLSWLNPNPDAAVAGMDSAEPSERLAMRNKQDSLKYMIQGTNLGEASLAALQREFNNRLQGIVVFSDGRSTEGTSQTIRDVAEQARRARIPFFVVGVGEDRPPVHLDIADVRVPVEARPDDHFPIYVEVTGEGLPNREINVYLDVYRPNTKEKFTTLERKITLKGALPRGQAEYLITPTDFGITPADEISSTNKSGGKPPEPSSGKPELEQGTWQFVARVARDKREIFAKPEHVHDPARVVVAKKPLRILLFAGSPMREYQFVRTLLVREEDKRRVELCVYLQEISGRPRRFGVVQDVPPNRLLTRFPDHFSTEADEPGEQVYNLASYDVILAFDPNWTELSRENILTLEKWVTHGGGMVLVGGNLNTGELARPGSTGGASDFDPEKLKPIVQLYPVLLKDARIGEDRSATDPVRLKFPGIDPEMEFMKLDEENPKSNPIDAWNEFFFGLQGSDQGQILRGFYTLYPVERAREGCTVVATFCDPQMKDAAGREPPYIVINSHAGNGKVVWLGSGEMWRLRSYREQYYERFWIKLARYAGGSNAGQTKRTILPVVGGPFPANSYIYLEGQFFAPDMKPLAKTARPEIKLTLPAGVPEKEIATQYTMLPKESPGEWDGWFRSRILVKSPGEYTVDMSANGQTQSTKFRVKPANPELDNTRPDFDALYELAGDLDLVIGRITDETTRKQLREALLKYRPGDSANPGDKDKPRLIFDMKSADLIPNCMISDPSTIRNKGGVQDIWDRDVPLWMIFMGIGAIVLSIMLVLSVLVPIFLSMKKPVRGILTALTILSLLMLAVAIGTWRCWTDPTLTTSIVLGTVVTLLSLEWLTRKLLRLA